MSENVQARTFAIFKHQGIEIHAVIKRPTATTPYVINHPHFAGLAFGLIQDAIDAIDAARIRVAEIYRLAGRSFRIDQP